jgi:flagellar biosynthesis/type III secretory pathway protein FliH
MMFGKLGSTGKTELELIGFTLASLVFNRENKADQDWLIRRFHEMHDILRETPIYQEILKEGREEGREEGLEKGIQKGQIEALRRAVVQIVLQRFPKLVRLAREKVAFAEDSDILLDLIGKLSVAADAENAKQCLLAIDESLEDLI